MVDADKLDLMEADKALENLDRKDRTTDTQPLLAVAEAVAAHCSVRRLMDEWPKQGERALVELADECCLSDDRNVRRVAIVSLLDCAEVSLDSRFSLAPWGHIHRALELCGEDPDPDIVRIAAEAPFCHRSPRKWIWGLRAAVVELVSAALDEANDERWELGAYDFDLGRKARPWVRSLEKLGRGEDS